MLRSVATGVLWLIISSQAFCKEGWIVTHPLAGCQIEYLSPQAAMIITYLKPTMVHEHGGEWAHQQVLIDLKLPQAPGRIRSVTFGVNFPEFSAKGDTLEAETDLNQGVEHQTVQGIYDELQDGLDAALHHSVIRGGPHLNGRSAFPIIFHPGDQVLFDRDVACREEMDANGSTALAHREGGPWARGVLEAPDILLELPDHLEGSVPSSS